MFRLSTGRREGGNNKKSDGTAAAMRLLARHSCCAHALAGASRGRRRALSALAERPAPIANIAEFASKRQTGVNMQALLSTGMGLRLEKSGIDATLPTQQRTLIQVAQFLHHELPIRLAHRAIELEELPHGLSDMPSVQTVRDWYGRFAAASLPTPLVAGVRTTAHLCARVRRQVGRRGRTHCAAQELHAAGRT